MIIFDPILLDEVLEKEILANDIHIYPISPTILSTDDDFGIKIFIRNYRQDYGLQAWVADDIWEQEPRIYLTRLRDNKSIHLINQDFIEQYNITPDKLEKLREIYPGIIYVFDKNDDSVYLHIRNMEGRALTYGVMPDAENFLVYLVAAGIIEPSPSLDILC